MKQLAQRLIYCALPVFILLSIHQPQICAKKTDSTAIDLSSHQRMAVLIFQGRDMRAAETITSEIIERLAEKSSVPVVPFDEMRQVLQQKKLKEGVADPATAAAVASDLSADVVLFGKMNNYIVKEFESGIPGKGNRYELTCDMKFDLELFVLVPPEEQPVLARTYQESHRDTRTNPFQVSLDATERDKLPAATMILLERSAKSISKKMLKDIKLGK